MLEDAILVADRNGHAIHLGLNDTRHLLATKPLLHALKKRRHLGLRVGVVQTHHRHRVLDLGEPLDGGSAHALSRRLRRDQLGMRRLKFLKLAQQRIKLLITELRPRFHIVEAVVAVDLLTEKSGAVGRGVSGHRPDHESITPTRKQWCHAQPEGIIAAPLPKPGHPPRLH